MKDREMITRLRELRRRREDRAREEVIKRHAALDRAAREGRQAASAVTEHLQRTVDAEYAAFGSLIGHPIKAASLHQLQGRFEIAARKTEQLRENEKMAGVAEQQRQAELSAARNDHREAMKALTKLDGVLEHLINRTARRCLALAELSEEEERGPTRLPT
ncbi:hypothetical protein NKH75_09970 [Mesorhizobium sp. M0984]|uniref:hypothetical protein n=1 Tax=unclassified Mesorhizobium TaxID=325217 RepID=UPI00333B42C5